MGRISALSSVGVGAWAASVAVIGGAVGLSAGVLAIAVALPGGEPSMASGATTADLPEARRNAVNGLRRLLESSHALIDASSADGHAPTRLVLWMEDVREPGRVNADEVMVLAHSPVLETVSALSVARRETAAPAMSSATLFSPDVSTTLREASGGASHVVATGVKGMRVNRLGTQNGRATLDVTLTWTPWGTDQPTDGGVKTAFTVTLSAVHRSR